MGQTQLVHNFTLATSFVGPFSPALAIKAGPMAAGTVGYAYFTFIIIEICQLKKRFYLPNTLQHITYSKPLVNSFFHRFVGILFTALNQTVVITGPDPLTQSSSK